jgi:hypothetical protein
MLTTGNTEYMTTQEAKAALGAIPQGRTLVYARGDIGADCSGSAELRKLRALFWTAQQTGQVALVQRRIGDGRFEYRARKRRSIFSGQRL